MNTSTLGETLSIYRFLTYSRDFERGGTPLYLLISDFMGDLNTYSQLDQWYQQKQALVRDISQKHINLDPDSLSNLCHRLEKLFTKNVLRGVLTHATEATLDEIESHKVLLSQTNLLPHLLESSGGKLEDINPFLFHRASQTPNFIKEIDLSECHYLTDKHIKSICQTFPYIQTIHLKGCYNLTKESLFALTTLPFLDRLSLPPGVFENLTLDEISFNSFINLKHLEFGAHTQLSPTAFSWISSLRLLHTLDLSGLSFTPIALEKLTTLIPFLIINDLEFASKSTLIDALSKVKANKISLQRTNLDHRDILTLIQLTVDHEKQHKRQKAISEDGSIIGIKKNLHTIILDQDLVVIPGFTEQCAFNMIQIETDHHQRDSSLDVTFGSSIEDDDLFFTGIESPNRGEEPFSPEEDEPSNNPFYKQALIY